MIATERVVAVVLAAGLSQRFGGDKLLHPVEGKPLAAHVADTLAAMRFGHRIAVCPAGSAERRDLFAARGFAILDNPDPARGMSSSLSLAAQTAIDLGADALLVCLADMPGVTAAHLLALIDSSAGNEIVATESTGVRSPPAIFARNVLSELLSITGDQGARNLLRRAATVAASSDLVRDIDTRDDLA